MTRIDDRAAMQLAIEQMRKESPESRARVDRVLREEGFESAGHTASYHLQCRALRLRPWQAPPVFTDVEIDPDCCGGRPEEIELLQRMLSLGISQFHPDPLRAIAEAEAEAEAEAIRSLRRKEKAPAAASSEGSFPNNTANPEGQGSELMARFALWRNSGAVRCPQSS